MSDIPNNGNTILFRLRELERAREKSEHAAEQVAIHEEQINGAGGVVKAVNALGDEVKSLRRAIYAVGGGILIAALTALFALAGHA